MAGWGDREDSKQEGVWSGPSQGFLRQSEVGFTANSIYYLTSCVTSTKYFIVLVAWFSGLYIEDGNSTCLTGLSGDPN